MRRATKSSGSPDAPYPHFYPRPPCGGRRDCVVTELITLHISIHALRAEGDPCFLITRFTTAVFLSTPSVRRATGGRRRDRQVQRHFYPRPPCGGRLRPTRPTSASTRISIHALRAEGDSFLAYFLPMDLVFLSTPSVRRATRVGTLSWGNNGFLSTPSVRRATLGRSRMESRLRVTTDFYPRPPCGGRS